MLILDQWMIFLISTSPSLPVHQLRLVYYIAGSLVVVFYGRYFYYVQAKTNNSR